MHSPGSEPTVTEIEEIYRTVRRRTPLLIIAAIFQLVITFFVVFLAAVVFQNRNEITRTQQQQAQQTAQFNIFLREFIDEQNYVCRVVAEVAKNTKLGETPPPGICTVNISRTGG